MDSVFSDLNSAEHAVAITGLESELGGYGLKSGWLRRILKWDWVGGRASVMSIVRMLPAALQGIESNQLGFQAKTFDELTRINNVTAYSEVPLDGSATRFDTMLLR